MSYSKDVEEAFKKAKQARLRAYAPYSNFKVGCCLKTKSGKFYEGHNIENVAFPSCTCAENIAIGNAIVNEGRDSLEFLVVCAEGADPISPCGNCRQIIAEHTNKDFPIYLCDTQKIHKKVTIGELMPNHFHSLS